jgi:SAM-dependent methyltransferase
MDELTLKAYDRDAVAFAAEWAAQPTPSDMQAVLRQFFKAGPTADVGCGSGRDTAWLHANGFAAIGYDASEGLLAEARRRHPELRFEKASLPELDGIEESSFANVLCETVIMHLPDVAIAPSVRRLLAILEPGGILYLSWRVTTDADRRDEHGRLYAAFDPALVLQALDRTEILLDRQQESASSGKLVRQVVARK